MMIEPLELETSARLEKLVFSPRTVLGVLTACSRCSVHAELLFSVVPDDCCVIGHFRFPASVKSKESYEGQLAEAATMYENLY